VGAVAAHPTSATLHPGVRGVYLALRNDILSGEMEPGEVLNQVHLARRMGVSRTPLREALRMLEADGLVHSEHQRRMRVTSVDAAEIDALYAQRILLESIGIALTVPRLSSPELSTIKHTLDAMHTGEATGDPSSWEMPHKVFHALLVKHAGSALEASIVGAGERAELYRRLFARSDPVTWATSRAEHDAVFAACLHREADEAVRRNARHLARTALVLIAGLDPELEPRAVRQALKLVAPAPALPVAALGT
jgi:DNA-binding GntR family transcriptional regulator